jgi:riboflavin kinase/FMN adenylyltransferase
VRVTRLPDVGARPRQVAVGTFDGVHLGHREVIRGADTVLTFDPHPLAVIRPEALPKLIDTFAIKRDIIASLGVEELVVIPFDRELARVEADAFVRDVLVERLHATHVSVGENFRFGRGARGDAELLRRSGAFETRVVPLVEVAGETVSSSRIRALVAAGEVRAAAERLDRPFLLEGEVVEGDRRGRELGMPTANIVPDDAFVVPGHGVYAARAAGHPAAVSVGVRPTFDTGRGLVVEVHLIDYGGDLYGRPLRVQFLERLRGERRFSTVAELVEQMWEDVDRARQIASATVPRS